MGFRNVPKHERPRERLEKHGQGSLSNAELLAVILQNGAGKTDVMQIANSIISTFSLHRIPDLSPGELQKIRGIGPATALQLNALFEFSRRCRVSLTLQSPLSSSKDVYEYASHRLSGLRREHFIVLHLDSKNRLRKEETVSIGTLDSSLVHPREVFRSAVRESSHAIVLLHNHPSGDPTPSSEDRKVTKTLMSASEIMGIRLLDHVIIGSNGYFSFADAGSI